jgi:hypothetical protein
VLRGAVVVAQAGVLASSTTTGPLASRFIQLKAATDKLLGEASKKAEEDDNVAGDSDEDGDWA